MILFFPESVSAEILRCYANMVKAFNFVVNQLPLIYQCNPCPIVVTSVVNVLGAVPRPL